MSSHHQVKRAAFGRQRLRLVLLAVGFICGLAACGGVPVTPADYARTEAVIAEANEMNASTLASGELYQAQIKLAAARTADRDGDGEEALRLLKEVELHAELAEVQAIAATRQKSLDEVQRGLDTLQRELDIR